MPFTSEFWKERREELIAKLKVGAKNRTIQGHAGKKHSEETKKILSLKAKSYGLSLGKNHPSKRPEVRQKIQLARMKQVLPIRNTSIELALFSELESRKIPFIKHKSILGFTQPDAFIEPNICVYADGDYWHNRPEVKEKDERINEVLPQAGFKVLRYTETEINENVEGVVDEIEEVIFTFPS